MTILNIEVELDYRCAQPTSVLLQIEAAALPEQSVDASECILPDSAHMARVLAQDGIGERIWLLAEERLHVRYQATVSIRRIVADIAHLPEVLPHLLPGETVPYLMPSRYCPSDRFVPFVEAEFGGYTGGFRVAAMRDWVARYIRYTPGSSGPATDARDTFVERQGVCRDFAHLLVTFARAAGVPARAAAVYAPDIKPQDFHAVAEVFLGGEWHLVDATGMATEEAMAKIGVGRDAADIAFLTSFGPVEMVAQTVRVTR